MAAPNFGQTPSKVPSLGSSLMADITNDDVQNVELALTQPATNRLKAPDGSSADPITILQSELQDSLKGIGRATKTTHLVESLLHRLEQIEPSKVFLPGEIGDDQAPNHQLSVMQWHDLIDMNFKDETHRLVVKTALVVTSLREAARRGVHVDAHQLSLFWTTIYEFLNGPAIDHTSVIIDDDESYGVLLFESLDGESLQLRVWLPESNPSLPQRSTRLSSRSCMSWILAGQVKISAKQETLSQALHLTRWRNEAYRIDDKSPCQIEVASDLFYAAFCLYSKPQDSNLELADDRGGRYPVARLGEATDMYRSWESHMAQGQQHSYKAEWELALRGFNTALGLCDTMDSMGLPVSSRYRQEVIGKLGCAHRRFGRYEQARDLLEMSLQDGADPTLFEADIMGELAVVYRLMGVLDKAKDAAEKQYQMAKVLQSNTAMCRAVGNLGMVNYQQFLVSEDHSSLQLAIAQIEERVRLARLITATLRSQDLPDNEDRIKYAITHEAIGLARLSLCYTSSGSLDKAIESSRGSLDVALTGDDSIVIAMSRFFHGRALLKSGRRDDAMEHLDPHTNPCTPAMALCREPSDEHRGYLQELVNEGVDLKRANSDGYTALDYAVFSGDTEAAQIVLHGLSEDLSQPQQYRSDSYLDMLYKESKLRKCYRELFQEKLRGAFRRKSKDEKSLAILRSTYARALAEDEEKRDLFDGFKVVPYSDFVRHRRIPHSRDGLARDFIPSDGRASDHSVEFVIFFSYRWISKEPGLSQPDDGTNSQYKRMIKAVETFLSLHSSVDREKLGLWVDLACVDQDNSAPGVAALLINLAQCDAIISLVDEEYYNRAWCSVEILMVQTLTRAYNLQTWYEQVPLRRSTTALPAAPDSDSDFVLRDGPVGIKTIMAEKKLTYEEDRSKLQFLERQTMLLG